MKKCTKCNQQKTLSEFRGKRAECKSCEKKDKLNNRRSAHGLCFKIYNSQLQSSKRRGHIPPLYTNIELEKWILSQDNFQHLYSEYIKSGYKKEKVPSVDSLDDNLPYSLDNIRLVDWITNKDKLHHDLINGIYTSTLKIVLQYDEEKNLLNEFFSMSEAHRVTGASISKISLVCNGKRKTHFGYIWKFKDE